MRKYILPSLIAILIIAVSFLFIGSCGRVEEGATTTTTTIPPSAGYKIYSGTDPSGQKFSFEYPEDWIVSEEVLTSDWNSGTWIMFEGAGDWQTGVPVLSLWIVPKSGTLTDEASYNAAAYSDRNVASAGDTGPGLISESFFDVFIPLVGITAESWRITYRTRLPLGRIWTEGDLEYHALMVGDLVSAESEWIVFQKGNYLYDLNFAAVGDKVTSREAAYIHAKDTFKFD